MDDTLDVGAGSMDGRVKHEACHTDAEVGGATLDDVALHVHLDEGGGSDFVVQHAEGVEQEVFGVLADAGLCREGRNMYYKVCWERRNDENL